jgi:hypothetical protein
MATPIAAEISRFGSLVSLRAITQKVISPGDNSFNPADRVMILQLGGKMLDTYTRLHFSMPALRKATSKDESLSLWTPTPFVKKVFFGVNVNLRSEI